MVWKQALAGLIVENHAAQLNQIKAPTLILCGNRDGIVTLQDRLHLQFSTLIAQDRHLHSQTPVLVLQLAQLKELHTLETSASATESVGCVRPTRSLHRMAS
ncbi:hypothetical protein [Chroogloeocystis siderophila]|jgi:pimeloyl-ACP methyl ester carboxylesterase|uniref:hypothetical protein n=1 Tax=Chroogloeocystis siderophila TaxID=329163 RepID=UPI0015C17DB0|nr:hypothetical protein [Chroogloeocystis siderophila]